MAVSRSGVSPPSSSGSEADERVGFDAGKVRRRVRRKGKRKRRAAKGLVVRGVGRDSLTKGNENEENVVGEVAEDEDGAQAESALYEGVFASVFDAFRTQEDREEEDGGEEEEDGSSSEEEAGAGVARKSQKMSIAELKLRVDRPELVESWDTRSPDPMLLVYLKGCEKTVPVPVHWTNKRHGFLSSGAGDKAAFVLPRNIVDTGIQEVRHIQSHQGGQEGEEGVAQGSMLSPLKVGRMDLDYQLLYNAFFVHQRKPMLTRVGEVCGEGSGVLVPSTPHDNQGRPAPLSRDLLEALGMAQEEEEGEGGVKLPPPWLRAMQRWGPPPAYPDMKTPGLNAPLPRGAAFGYHRGGWGRPPVDAFGTLVYGHDVLGVEVEDDEDGASGSESSGGDTSAEDSDWVSDGEGGVPAGQGPGTTLPSRGGHHGGVSLLSASDKELYEHLDEGVLPKSSAPAPTSAPFPPPLPPSGKEPPHEGAPPEAEAKRTRPKPREKARRYKF